MGNLIFRAISEQIPQEILWYIAGQAISSIFSTVGNILNTRQVLLPQSYIKLNMLKSTVQYISQTLRAWPTHGNQHDHSDLTEANDPLCFPRWERETRIHFAIPPR